MLTEKFIGVVCPGMGILVSKPFYLVFSLSSAVLKQEKKHNLPLGLTKYHFI